MLSLFHHSFIKVIVSHQLEKQLIPWEVFIAHDDFTTPQPIPLQSLPSSSQLPPHTPPSPSTDLGSSSSHESSPQINLPLSPSPKKSKHEDSSEAKEDESEESSDESEERSEGEEDESEEISEEEEEESDKGNDKEESDKWNDKEESVNEEESSDGISEPNDEKKDQNSGPNDEEYDSNDIGTEVAYVEENSELEKDQNSKPNDSKKKMTVKKMK